MSGKNKTTNRYKYENYKDLWSVNSLFICEYFEPIFKSFKIDKKNFILQTVNLILLFVLVNLLIGDFIDFLVTKITDTGIVGMRVLILFAIAFIVSFVSKSSMFKWQNCYELSRKISRHLFVLLLLTNFIIYGIRYYYVYEPRNKK